MLPAHAGTENFTIGLDWAPVSLPGARFSINYYEIEYTDRVDTIGTATTPAMILANPSAYEGVAIFDPTEAQVMQYIAYGTAGGRPFLAFNANFTPNTNWQPGDVDFIYDGRRLNIGVVRTNGFDMSASYAFDAFAGRHYPRLRGGRLRRIAEADAVAEKMAEGAARIGDRRLGCAGAVEPAALNAGDRTGGIGDRGQQRRPGFARIRLALAIPDGGVETQRRPVEPGGDRTGAQIGFGRSAGDRTTSGKQAARGFGRARRCR